MGTDLAPPCPHCGGRICAYELHEDRETFDTLKGPPRRIQAFRATCVGCHTLRTYIEVSSAQDATATEVREAHERQGDL